MDYLGTWNIRRPVETFGFIAANYQYVLLVNYDDLTFADLSIVNLERSPFQSLEIVKCMLIELSKIEELLTKTLGFFLRVI